MNWRFPKGIQLHQEKRDFAAADDSTALSAEPSLCSEVGVSKGGLFPLDCGVNNSSISLFISDTVAGIAL